MGRSSVLVAGAALAWTGFLVHGSSLARSGESIAPHVADLWLAGVLLGAAFLVAIPAAKAFGRGRLDTFAGALGFLAGGASAFAYAYLAWTAPGFSTLYFYFWPGAAIAWTALAFARRDFRMPAPLWLVGAAGFALPYLVGPGIALLEGHGRQPTEAYLFLGAPIGFGLAGGLFLVWRFLDGRTAQASRRLASVGLFASLVLLVLLVFTALAALATAESAKSAQAAAAFNMVPLIQAAVLVCAWLEAAAYLEPRAQARLDLALAVACLPGVSVLLIGAGDEAIGAWLAAMAAAWLAVHLTRAEPGSTPVARPAPLRASTGAPGIRGTT